MNRRSFLKMIPAWGAAAVVPTAILSEEQKLIPLADLTEKDGVVQMGLTLGTMNLDAKGNLLTKQYQHFPIKMSDWKLV